MINKQTQFILSLYHFSIFLRDTLEYTFIKKEYAIKSYLARKNALSGSLKERGQMKTILDKLGENGQKVFEKLTEFLDLLYSESSTVIKLSGEELRIDHAQHLLVFEMVIGLHQTVWDLLIGYLLNAEKQQELSIPVRPLLVSDEAMYRTIVYLTIMNEIERVFAEFQKIMQESRGEKTPQGNYIVNDLSKLVHLLMFQKAHNKITDTAFNEMIDFNLKVVEMIEGKRELPILKDEDVNPEANIQGVIINGIRRYSFQEMFAQARQITRQVLMEKEQNWKQLYQPISQQLMALVETETKLDANHHFDA